LNITIAKHAGYCYGVQRALKMAREAMVERAQPIYTLGPIIHNPQVVAALERQGVIAINSVDDVSEGTVIIRTHGVDPDIIRSAKSRGLYVIDATCPFVAKAQQRAARLIRDGYSVVIVGERNHPEVAGLLAYTNNRAIVVENAKEVESIDPMGRIGVVVQTTQSLENLKSIVGELLCKTKELKLFNTICNATSQRQEAAGELAQEVGLMLVVGGKNSANTTRLAQICRESNERTYHIETADEVNVTWLDGVDNVGITAGASTPDWILQEVIGRLKSISRAS